MFYVISAGEGCEEALHPIVPAQGCGNANIDRPGIGEGVLVFRTRDQKVHIVRVVAQRAIAKVVTGSCHSSNRAGILEPVKEVFLWNLHGRTETRPSRNNVPVDDYECGVNPTHILNVNCPQNIESERTAFLDQDQLQVQHS